MFKCNNVTTARELARETGRLFGMGIFDGKFYVGAENELDGAGVARIEGDYRVMVQTVDGEVPFEPAVESRPAQQALAIAKSARRIAAKNGWGLKYRLQLV